MRRSPFNPRIVLPCIAGAILLSLCMEAYVEHPRIRVGFGVIDGTVHIRADKIGCNLQSARFRGRWESRLQSAGFVKKLQAADPLFPPVFRDTTIAVTRTDSDPSRPAFGAILKALGGARTCDVVMMTSRCARDERLEDDPTTPPPLDSERTDLSVSYMMFQAYGVSQPSRWVEWLQDDLPGMPDRARLVAQAEADNRAVKAAIEKEILRAARDVAASADGK